MAIVRTSALVGSISGRIGGIQFSNTRAGLVLSKSPARIRKSSTRALNARLLVQLGIARWQQGTEAERAAWRSAALQFPLPNRLGQRRQLSGYQFWMRAFLTSPDPPDYAFNLIFKSPPNEDLTNPSAIFTEGGPYTINYTKPAGPGQFQRLIYGSRTVSTAPRSNFRTPIRIFQGLNLGNTIDVQPFWDAILGPLIQGEVVQVGIRMMQNASPNPPIHFIRTTVL